MTIVDRQGLGNQVCDSNQDIQAATRGIGSSCNRESHCFRFRHSHGNDNEDYAPCRADLANVLRAYLNATSDWTIELIVSRKSIATATLEGSHSWPPGSGDDSGPTNLLRQKQTDRYIIFAPKIF